MLYEVFSPFTRCADLHRAHRSLEEAKRCFDQIDQPEEGIALHPATGKCIHAIVAVASDGTQREFTNQELNRVDALSIDRKIVLENIPRVTTFAHIADLSYAALVTVPQLSVDLTGFFDYENRNKHYWSTKEGLGQTLAYVQQAFFTLEICLKALLESTGQLVKIPDAKWKQHEPGILYKRLKRETMRILEDRWAQDRSAKRPREATFQAFLESINDMYRDWRYIPERKDTNLSADLRPIVAACRMVLETSQFIFRRDYPLKLRVTTESFPSEQGEDQLEKYTTILVSGTVESVSVPEGFDPHSSVEVTVSTEEHGLLTLEVYRRNPEDYHGLEGRKITVTGLYNPNRPGPIGRPNILAIDDKEVRETRYTTETRTLQGTIYDVTRAKEPDRLDAVNLFLQDETYFTMVQCLFLTREEQAQITGALDSGKQLQLGDRISIQGQVTLKNGLPVVLVGSDHINKLTPRHDQ